MTSHLTPGFGGATAGVGGTHASRVRRSLGPPSFRRCQNAAAKAISSTRLSSTSSTPSCSRLLASPRVYPSAPSIAATAARKGRTMRAAAAGDDDAPSEDNKEELDTDKLLKEVTDMSDLGGRGEVLFLSQVVLLVLLVFPPAIEALAEVETIQKDNLDPVIGVALMILAGLLVFTVGSGRMEGSHVTPPSLFKLTPGSKHLKFW